jgi:putative FmdB family regulatory protein
MPTYEYVCPKCGHEFEQFQQMSDPPLRRCPQCKKLGVKRLVGKGAGLIFKGTGFYITDYKKTAAPKESGEGGSSGSSDKSGEGKSDAAKAGVGDKSGGEGKSSAASSPSTAKPSADAKPGAKDKSKREK